ncbi:MAG: hypothetical protein Q4G40_02600 [Brachybacterium sp.]|nr:hypothetical protein [Brachybacterium sp.]
MEHITAPGHPDPIPASPVAAKLLRERLDKVHEEQGADAASAFEARVGERLVLLLNSGKPSIDLGNMRAIVNYADTPVEDEEEPTGIRRALDGLRDKLAQRGGPSS